MLFKDYMGGSGIPAGMARALGGSIANSLTAAGSVITDALDLAASKNIVTTCTQGQGVQLTIMSPGESQIVFNATSAPLYVYPGAATVALNQLAVGVAGILPPYSCGEFYGISATLVIANLSA